MQSAVDPLLGVLRVALELWPLLLVYVLWRLHTRLRDVESLLHQERSGTRR